MNRPEPTLTEAAAEAIRSGTDELARLDRIVAEAENRLRDAWQDLSAHGRRSSRDDDGFLLLLDSVGGDLRDRLGESRRVASTFNIAFFGRTGAGKSALLSALGGLNGELVSDGRSDFTTDVRPLDWRGCRLYDTPGINGWGRTRSRSDLEEAAREAVEVADVVLLCFDSQGAQAAEFRKVAEWVRAYRKPVIAVLNMRNPRWRDPARVPAVAQREGLAGQARQHADTITGELEAIELSGVPVVAIHSKRALFARASAPFAGPAASELEAERSVHGVEYLDRWSNLPVLEQLISACIVEGAADLRLAALREGLQAGLRGWAGQIEREAIAQQGRGVVIERTIAEWLNVLGYPETAWRDGLLPDREVTGLLRQLEAARGEPFAAPASGRLEGHVRNLLSAYLYPHRMGSLRAAEERIRDAFDSEDRVSWVEFEKHVIDAEALSESIATVADLAGGFLSDNLDLAGVDAQIDLGLIDRSAPDIRGDAGIGRRRIANVLRAGGLLSSSAAAALGVVAATNVWNPGGWAAAVVLGGLGVFSAVTNLLGRLTRKRAEENRVAGRARALAEARSAVSGYFDNCETRQLASILGESWANASRPLVALLADALHIRMGCERMVGEAAWLRGQADGQPPAASPTGVIRRATERVLAQQSAWSPPTVAALLLGEDWLLDSTPGVGSEQLSELDSQRLLSAADADRAGFSAHLTQTFRTGFAAPVRQWLDSALTSESLDQQAREEVSAALSLLDRPPSVVVVGDYSSGKTSLIKRLLAEAGADTPASLRVEAGQATCAPRGYPFGCLELVDAPGFQSGHEDHDVVALEASHDAALTIVVLHVNLLIGDPSRLERLLVGDEARVGKAAHTIFVIGRIDEIGADPRTAAADFLVRRHRKVEELLSILESRGLAVEPGQVLTLSADPYALVGDRLPVTKADYPTDCRVWDGVSTLCEPLLALQGENLVSLSAAAAVDRGRSALLSAQRRAESEIDGLEEAQVAAARLERLLETSLAELGLLKNSIEWRARRVVNDHANEVTAEAVGAGPDEVEAMAKRLKTWWEDPRLESGIDSLSVEVDRELDEWSTRHASEFDRELKRFEFVMGADKAVKDKPEAAGEGVHVAAQVVSHLANFAKAIGNRNAIYGLGKAMKVKFKPWGAVKAGAKVGRVGAILGVVSVALDTAAWVTDQQREDGRERARQAATQHIRATVDSVVANLLEQDEGPMAYVKQINADMTRRLEELHEKSQRQRQSAQDATQRLKALVFLQDAGEQLTKAGTEVTT